MGTFRVIGLDGLEIDAGDGVEQLGEVLLNHGGVGAVRQNVQQVSRCHEIETREGHAFRFEVLGQGLLAQLQLRVQFLKLVQDAGPQCHVDHVGLGHQVDKNRLELGVGLVEPVGVQRQLNADIVRARAGENRFKMRPRALHLAPQRQHRIGQAQTPLPVQHIGH